MLTTSSVRMSATCLSAEVFRCVCRKRTRSHRTHDPGRLRGNGERVALRPDHAGRARLGSECAFSPAVSCHSHRRLQRCRAFRYMWTPSRIPAYRIGFGNRPPAMPFLRRFEAPSTSMPSASRISSRHDLSPHNRARVLNNQPESQQHSIAGDRFLLPRRSTDQADPRTGCDRVTRLCGSLFWESEPPGHFLPAS